MLRTYLSRTKQRLRALGKSNREVFDDIYRHKKWKGPGEISSGLGSRPENSAPYEDLIVDYIRTNGIKSIVDVGCGDFQVAGRILDRLPANVAYVGLDVSQVAIDHNARFASERVSFLCRDAANDPLPEGDLVLVREVLQHLPNKDVIRILAKLDAFDHALVTNTIGMGARERNIDIAPGSGSRAAFGGGPWLDKPPFNRRVETLLAVPHKDQQVSIVTVRVLGPATT